MKKVIIYSVLSLFFIATACNSEEREKKQTDKEDHNYTECDAFFKEYENWTEKYVDLTNLLKARPDKEEIKAEKDEMSKELSQWGLKWNSMVNCKGEEKYQKKYDELTTKITEIMSVSNY